MQIDAIKATGIEMTDAIREAVEGHIADLDPLVERYGEAVSVRAEVERTTAHHHKGEIYRAEFNLKIPGTLLRAEATHEDLYAAINEAAGDLARQVAADKDRHDAARREEGEGEDETEA